VKNALLLMPLLAVGVLAAGCAASPSTSSSASAASAAGSSSSASAASSSGTPAATASASGTPACTSADLQASLGGGSGTGMSQNHTGLQLRNIGSSACTLYGYPGVSWVAGADGHQVGAAAERQSDPSGAEKTVTLAPGALASAPLDIVDAAVFSPSECKPVPVRGLRIYPPGEQAALFLPLPTNSGGYGECSVTTKDPALTIGYLESGVQPGGGAAG
jgi:hypothetical protein